MNKLLSSRFSRKLYRYTVLWPIAFLRAVNINRYHKQWATIFSAYLVVATLSAIKYQADGSWGMPIILFNVAILTFILGSSELMLVLDQRYKGIEQKCQAISRSISYYGVSLSIVAMCELYSFTVKF